MTDQPMSDRPSAANRPAGGRGARRRPPLYRTVLGIAIAALIAAWLPFSVLYVTAANKHAQVAAVAKPTASGPTSAAASPAQPPASVTTRVS